MTSAEEVQRRLQEGLQPSHLEVTDTSGGCGSAFEAVVVSGKFEGQKLLQRHRLVNDCLADVLPQIHAFSQKTYTPAEWDQRKASGTA